MPSVFLTGASGYIGGQVLHELARSHPDYEITALLRDEKKAKTIQEAYPKVRIVIGDLDNEALIEQEAAKASIVLQLADTKALKAVQAIHRALESQKSGEPVFYVQVSGASVLAAAEIANTSYVPGSPSDAVYDDLSGVADVAKMIRAHAFRAVDNYVLDIHAKSPSVYTALVFPPIIYGVGEGPINQRSIQIPDLAKLTLERGNGFQVGAGLSRWGNIHVRDLGRIFTGLAAAAAAKKTDGELWNENGIYLTGIGEVAFKEISEKIAHEAVKQSFNTNEEIKVLPKADANTLLHFGSIMYGTNARSKSRRAAEYLGWAPKEYSLEEEYPRVVADEAKKLGK